MSGVHPKTPDLIVSKTSCDPCCDARGEGCRFRIAWAINPHMRVGAACGRRAARQHGHFVSALERAGASVARVPFIHGAFDSVFAKDNALIVARPDGAIEALPTRPRFPERTGEQERRSRDLDALGFQVWAPSEHVLEGGDVVVLPGARGAFLGYGFRSSLRALDDVERFLDCDVIPLELADPRLYHLDMALTVLADGTALACLSALTYRTRRLIERSSFVSDLIEVPLAEALRFAVNMVQIGSSIVTGSVAPLTMRALRARGYKTVCLPLDQFHVAGGSAACLVSRVHRQAALPAVAAA